MKVLVTGGFGFIGSHFVNLIARKHPDWDITVIDSFTYAANPHNVKATVKLTVKDICELESLPEVDYIVHFAAESHVDNSIKNGKPFIKTNIEGTYNLVELAKGLKSLKKFIHISTDEVYGDMHNDFTTTNTSDEMHQINPSSYYSATKAASDMIVMSAGKTFNLPYLITRTCNNFGENQHSEKMIPKILEHVADEKMIGVYGDGSQIREWIYADDNAEAIYNLMMSDAVNEVFNIGSEYRISNNELIGLISEILDQPVFLEYVEDRLGHDKRYSVDSSKYQEMFGKALKKTLKQYLQEQK